MLSIHGNLFPLTRLLHLLRFTLNVHTLRLSLTKLDRGKIGRIKRHKVFQAVSRTNCIRNVVLNIRDDFELNLLFIILCPQLNYLTVNGESRSTSTGEALE